MFNEFVDLSRKDLLKVLAVVVLSDGTLNKEKNYIRLFTSLSSDCQHNLFKFLCYKLFNKKPLKYVISPKRSDRKNEQYIQSTLISKEAINELLSLNSIYKTTYGKINKNQFLKLKQPNCNFLLNSSEKLKWLALRTWFDFDGSISPLFKLRKKRDIKRNKSYDYYQVQFECEIRIAETNPSLVAGLLNLCHSLGLNAIKKRKNNWSGIDGICISNLKDIEKFIMQGPITEVKISRKSKRFFGIPKQKICIAVRKILQNNSISKSKYFKNESEAVNYKNQVDKLLLDIVLSLK